MSQHELASIFWPFDCSVVGSEDCEVCRWLSSDIGLDMGDCPDDGALSGGVVINRGTRSPLASSAKWSCLVAPRRWSNSVIPANEIVVSATQSGLSLLKYSSKLSSRSSSRMWSTESPAD